MTQKRHGLFFMHWLKKHISKAKMILEVKEGYRG